MKDKNGVKIVEEDNQNQLSQEDLIAKTVSGVLDGLKDQDDQNNELNNPPANEVDPFDFSSIDQEINNQNINVNNDQNNNQNINNQNNQNNQPIHDPRVDDLVTNMQVNTKNIEANGRVTSMNNFIMEFNNEITGVPELEVYRNEAIVEAKKSIASGGYIPAKDMISYLHGKASVSKLKNVEENNNPNIDNNQFNPDGSEKPFDLEKATAEEIREEYKNVVF